MTLLLSLALVVVSQATPPKQGEQPKRPDTAQQTAKPQVQPAPPPVVEPRPTHRPDSGVGDGNRGQQPPSTGFWRFDNLGDLLSSFAAAVMAVIAGLQLAAFNRQGRTLAPQLEAMQGLASALGSIGKNSESLSIGIQRLENRLTTMEATIRAKGHESPYKKP